jgi:hypothetical protein
MTEPDHLATMRERARLTVMEQTPRAAGAVDVDGNIWVWGKDQHGGPHWDVTHPSGDDTNVRDKGILIGKDRFPNKPR